jgi:hypothetical protein
MHLLQGMLAPQRSMVATLQLDTQPDGRQRSFASCGRICRAVLHKRTF